jgi:hypothetical protein
MQLFTSSALCEQRLQPTSALQAMRACSTSGSTSSRCTASASGTCGPRSTPRRRRTSRTSSTTRSARCSRRSGSSRSTACAQRPRLGECVPARHGLYTLWSLHACRHPPIHHVHTCSTTQRCRLLHTLTVCQAVNSRGRLQENRILLSKMERYHAYSGAKAFRPWSCRASLNFKPGLVYNPITQGLHVDNMNVPVNPGTPAGGNRKTAYKRRKARRGLELSASAPGWVQCLRCACAAATRCGPQSHRARLVTYADDALMLRPRAGARRAREGKPQNRRGDRGAQASVQRAAHGARTPRERVAPRAPRDVPRAAERAAPADRGGRGLGRRDEHARLEVATGHAGIPARPRQVDGPLDEAAVRAAPHQFLASLRSRPCSHSCTAAVQSPTSYGCSQNRSVGVLPCSAATFKATACTCRQGPIDLTRSASRALRSASIARPAAYDPAAAGSADAPAARESSTEYGREAVRSMSRAATMSRSASVARGGASFGRSMSRSPSARARPATAAAAAGRGSSGDGAPAMADPAFQRMFSGARTHDAPCLFCAAHVLLQHATVTAMHAAPIRVHFT